jgi:hypothetical protein
VEQASQKYSPVFTSQVESSIPRQYYYFTFVVVAILAWVTFQLIRSNAKKPEPVKELVIDEPANSDPFQTAEIAFAAGNYRSYLLEVEKLIYHTCAHQYNLPHSVQNLARIKASLIAAGAAHELTDNIYNFLSDCEWQLYTPSMDAEEVLRIRNEAPVIIGAIKASA